MTKRKLEFYVLNGDFNKRTVEPFNIFDNWVFEQDVQKHIKEYKKGKLDYNQFKEEVRKSLMWQEWGRCEYEIFVTDWEGDKLQKIDCYEQVLPNLDILCRYILGDDYKTNMANKPKRKTQKDKGGELASQKNEKKVLKR